MSIFIIIFELCFVYIAFTRCEEFNLFGDAGLAYAIEVNLGHPHQKLNLLVDTGSTTLAIASFPREDSNTFFHANNSNSIYDSGKEVHATYFQAMWVARLASDYIMFPSLPSVPEVRSDIALITKSYNFFMKGSTWQGLLGLAYRPISAWGDNIVVESWLESLERMANKPISFQLKLCATQSPTNATHYGNFQMMDDEMQNGNRNKTFRTPILKKRWYEVGVISIKVISPISNSSDVISIAESPEPNVEMCQTLNKEKSIVDSGTTNIRLSPIYFRKIVDELKSAAQSSNMLILDEFWYHGEAACWPEPQQWSLPWLGIDLLSYEAEDQYFTIELPPENYMRVVTARNSSSESGAVSEFCYKLGLGSGDTGTVLGYTAMEGLQVLFNRSADWIGWQSSSCGPDARITGPYKVSESLNVTCQLVKPISDVAVSIKAAQWTLCALSIIAAAILIYLLTPCVKAFFIKSLPISTQISMSQAALVEQESN